MDPEIPTTTAAPTTQTLSRRKMLAGAGVLGLGGALGVGYLMRERSDASISGDRARAAHLLRRAGFSPTVAEVDLAVKDGLTATTDRLLNPTASDTTLETRLSRDTFDFTRAADVRLWWLVRMASTERPLVEKMTLFWHGLLTSSYRKAGAKTDLMYVQNQFLRAHALGSLRDLLVGITKDGAMLHWLDGTGSTRAHPNENYARELMELFTMGVGNYTETDVRESARALTGWYVARDGSVSFRPAAHDNGSKTFLGHTGNLGLEDIVDIILAHPATPRYISTRLFQFFVHPSPTDAELKPAIDAYAQSKGNIRAIVGAILRSEAFYSGKAYRGLVKSPTELTAGLLRQFNLPVNLHVAGAGEAMGQALLDPPNVAGWPGGSDWLSTGSWMARARFLLYQSEQQREQVGRVLGSGKPEDVVATAVKLMVDDDLTPRARGAIVDHARALNPAHLDSTGAAQVFFLVGATPEYQLA